MTDNYKVSIVVAIYKSAPFLDKLITSIICQTYKNLEIILVDDGSPDESGTICDNYAKKDPRIVVIHKQNGGACEARNVGIEKATGDYLMIVDGDDWLSLDYVDYLLNIAVSTNSELAFSSNIFTTRDQQQISHDTIEIWTPEKAACAIIYPYMDIGPWNKIYKMSLIRENHISFSVPWSGEGLYFAVMAAQYSTRVGVGHRKVYNYRLNNSNSGLTHYNVQMGINALWNIKNIGANAVIKTKKFQHAVEWHIWKNYGFLLQLIIATNNQVKMKKEYHDCLNYIHRKLIHVLIHSKISFRKKISMIKFSLMPVFWIKKGIKDSQEALLKDNMK